MQNDKLKMKRSIIIAGLLLSLPFFVAAADGPNVGDEAFSIGPRASYFKPKDADKGTWYAGAQVRLRMSSVVGLEGSVDYRKNDYANGGVSVKSYPVQATLLANLVPNSPVTPYLLGGVGWYYTQVSGPLVNKSTDNRFGLHAGGGLEAKLNRSLSLDGSYRYIWLSDFTAQNTNALQKTYHDSGYQVTMALNFLF